MSAARPVIVVAPDSFKGSLSARQVAEAIGKGLLRALPDADIRLCPIADGGEGTLDAFSHAGGRIEKIQVRGAGGDALHAAVSILPGGTAVIESAEIVGLTDPVGTGVAVDQRSTAGIGEALLALMQRGQRRILIGLGGSSTNDGGAGMLCALGMKLFDDGGRELSPAPADLARLARVDPSGLDTRLSGLELVAMSDVDNPLCGPQGATAIFGPQKGVAPQRVAELDAVLGRFADKLEQALGKQAAALPGAGAAGGLGFGLLMLGARFASGAHTIADHVGMDAMLEGADWMITGEGRSDAQTLRGKAPFVAASRAKNAGVPASLLSGGIDQQSLAELAAHFAGCFSITSGPITLADAIAQAETLITDRAEQLALLWKAASGPRTTTM